MLTERVLNRTLLQRQHLLARTPMSALAMTEHLVGLQAQEVLPPYISLWSRIEDFDPLELSDLLVERKAVRILLMRGTIHLVSAMDCLELRPLMQGMLDKITRNSAVTRPVADIPRTDLAQAARDAFTAGPLTPKELGVRLGKRFPDHPPGALANTVREMLPLVQLPPRGLWQQAGGQNYDTAESWLGSPLSAEPDMRAVARRYLRAFGPASAADMTVWCRVTGISAVLVGMKDELVTYRDQNGRKLFDLEGLPIAEEDAPAPVRLLGTYDNLWLSHADRSRVADPEKRAEWMGRNGGTAKTVFVDGRLEGLWRQVDGRIDVRLFRRLSRTERQQLDAEVAALEIFLGS